jgi:hypothetical protein
MTSFAELIVQWPSSGGDGSSLVVGLARAAWRDSSQPSKLVDLTLNRLAGGMRPPNEYEAKLGSAALELIVRLADTEALRGGPEAVPGTIRLCELHPSGGVVCPPAPIWWLSIDGCPGRRQLPNALLQQLRQSIASRLAEGPNPRPYARCVLVVSITGPDRPRPDLIVVGPAHGAASQAREASCIRTFQFSRMRTESAEYIRSQAEDLQVGLSENGLAAFFDTRKAGDARDVVRNELKQQLGEIMTLLERLPGAPKASSEEALHALREAATVVVFRMMFLGEIESRGLLWRLGAKRRQLFEAASAALDTEVAAAEARHPHDMVAVFMRLCAVLRGAVTDPDIEVSGGSIFATRPNDRFDEAVVAYLGAIDKSELALTGPQSCAWRRVLADTFQITQGVVVNRASASDEGRSGLGYLGLGGTEHVHRILGDVYEQILALKPSRAKEGMISLSSGEGKTERKSLGAHYTPENLVEELVRPAVGAMFRHAWEASGHDLHAYAARVATLRVLDPAMGSAHFLTVAAREIATELEWVARFQKPRHVQDPDAHEPLRQKDPLLGLSGTPDELPVKDGLVRRLRDVVQRCCHGVDVSPIAVELGKLSLWLFTMTAQKQRLANAELARPELAFLDANIQCGDSLIGVFWRDARRIIDERFGVPLLTQARGPNQQHLFDRAGTLVAERIEEVSKLLQSVHGDDAHLLAWALREPPAWLPRPVEEASAYALRRAVHQHVQACLADLRWVFDLATLAVFFDVRKQHTGVRTTALEAALKPLLPNTVKSHALDWAKVVSEKLETKDHTVVEVRGALVRLATHGRLVNGRPMRALHWGLAFPDVFPVDDVGFDLIVANPPFIGDRSLRGAMGAAAVDFLTERYTARRNGGTCDLAGFFVLRFDDLLDRKAGCAATIAPNTLAQAKNRKTVLVPLVRAVSERAGERFCIRRAMRSRVWPGDAAVHVCTVQLDRQSGERVLVEPEGEGWLRATPHHISTFLDDLPDAPAGRPDAQDLSGCRPSIFFTGMFLRGCEGESYDFIKSESLSEEFLQQARACGEGDAVYAYLNNQLVQNRRRPVADQVCVDFYDVLKAAKLLDAAAEVQLGWLGEHYPYCLAAIADVRRARARLPDSPSNREHKARWWMFGSPRVEVRRHWASEDTIVVVGNAASKVWSMVALPKRDPKWDLQVCPSHALAVLPSSPKTAFAVLQSALGEIHVRRNSSTLKADLRFSPEFALAGFPFPWPSAWSEELHSPYPLPAPASAQAVLNAPAERLTELRNALLANPEERLPEVRPLPKDWGPTELYNRYDDSEFHTSAIHALRQTHVDLLDAVLGAYAADRSLPQAGSMFAAVRADMAREADAGWTFDRPWIDGSERYVPKVEYRRRIVEALLQANVERWAQEIALIGVKLALHLGRDAALAAKFEKGVSAEALSKALNGSVVPVHADDALAVLEAGVERREWVRIPLAEGDGFRWVGTLSKADRSKIALEAEKALKVRADAIAKEEEAKAKRKKEAEAEAKRKEEVAASSKGAQGRGTGISKPKVGPRTSREKGEPAQAPPVLLVPQRPADPYGGDRVLSLVAASKRPLSKSEILALAGLTEQDWVAAKHRIDSNADFVQVGDGRGARYVCWAVLLDLYVDAIREAGAGAAANKQQIFEKLQARGVPDDDGIWEIARKVLVDAGRVTTEGKARGTRYRA